MLMRTGHIMARVSSLTSARIRGESWRRERDIPIRAIGIEGRTYGGGSKGGKEARLKDSFAWKCSPVLELI